MHNQRPWMREVIDDDRPSYLRIWYPGHRDLTQTVVREVDVARRFVHSHAFHITDAWNVNDMSDVIFVIPVDTVCP